MLKQAQLILACNAGKGNAKVTKAGLVGKKRKADALLGQETEGPEPSETGLSEASGLPGTTETSARCMVALCACCC